MIHEEPFCRWAAPPVLPPSTESCSILVSNQNSKQNQRQSQNLTKIWVKMILIYGNPVNGYDHDHTTHTL